MKELGIALHFISQGAGEFAGFFSLGNDELHPVGSVDVQPISRKRIRASKPESAAEKARECRAHLASMSDCEGASDTTGLLDNLSAFLGAFRTVVYRLNGVTKNRLGQKARREHQEVDLLVHKANLELHGDGVVIHPQFTVNDYIFSNPWTSNWAPDEGRWAPNWQSNWAPKTEQTPLITLQDGWRFHDRPEDLIDSCRAGMDALEKYLGDITTRPV